MKKQFIISIVLLLCLALTACNKADTVTMYNTNIGSLAHDSVDVMGVTYDLYDNGYALIEKILHENALLNETVNYNGKDYTVFSFVQPKVSTLQETGAFGHGELKSPDNLVLPSTIVGIPNYALTHCNAGAITLPSGLQSIGIGAFRECRNIATIELPDSLTYIGASKLFQNCTSLVTVEFPTDCQIQFFDNTFEGCTSLEAITIPASVDYIGGLAFYQCYGLNCVIIEDGVQQIKEGAFYEYPALEALVIPDSVTTIADYAFQGCTNLKEITLPDNMTDVSAKLFTDIYKQNADVSGLTIYVNPDLVSYVQSLYPTANVVSK